MCTLFEHRFLLDLNLLRGVSQTTRSHPGWVRAVTKSGWVHKNVGMLVEWNDTSFHPYGLKWACLVPTWKLYLVPLTPKKLFSRIDGWTAI